MSHPIHPMVVHFPIALLFTSVFFDLLGIIKKDKNFDQTGSWLLVLGLLGGVVAAIFGAWSEDVVKEAGIPESAIDLHETLAYVTIAAFGVLLLFRWWARKRWSVRDRVVYLCGAALGLLLLSMTGFYGGNLVYEYGAAVKLPASSMTTAPATEISPP
ncbi:MAG TPA: DUF2231 domain-containing protein [Nitrospiria bacterium]|nr:DUF2231 domain-containing protein [Nitrospiria bacterium]